MMITPHIERLIDLALEEDVPHGDVTSSNLFSKDTNVRAIMRAKSDFVFCGGFLVQRIFEKLNIQTQILIQDGTRVTSGTSLVEISGRVEQVLIGERTALNFASKLSGIATLSAQYAEKVKGLHAKVCDTRKTTPGHRTLEKYAVKIGGCYNHRSSLSDGILIKDNHIHAMGGVTLALNKMRTSRCHLQKIEIEVKTIEELREALSEKADVIMLDNRKPAQIRECVQMINGKAVSEASGGINLTNVREYAETGVDFVSVGDLTHGAKSVDINMKIVGYEPN